MVRQNQYMKKRTNKKAVQSTPKRKGYKTLDGRVRGAGGSPHIKDGEKSRILHLIKQFETGERSEPITWALLEQLTGRPTRSMHRHDEIYNAYAEAKVAQAKRRMDEKAGKKLRFSGSPESEAELRIAELEKDLAKANAQIAHYDSMFERLIKNGLQKQIDVQQLLDEVLKPKVTQKSLRKLEKGQERQMLDTIESLDSDFARRMDDDRQ
jgi:hypothetical protein